MARLTSLMQVCGPQVASPFASTPTLKNHLGSAVIRSFSIVLIVSPVALILFSYAMVWLYLYLYLYYSPLLNISVAQSLLVDSKSRGRFGANPSSPTLMLLPFLPRFSSQCSALPMKLFLSSLNYYY